MSAQTIASLLLFLAGLLAGLAAAYGLWRNRTARKILSADAPSADDEVKAHRTLFDKNVVRLAVNDDRVACGFVDALQVDRPAARIGPGDKLVVL